jgi:hypothetical protein
MHAPRQKIFFWKTTHGIFTQSLWWKKDFNLFFLRYFQVGAALIKLVLDTCKIWDKKEECQVPAFKHELVGHFRKQGQFFASEALVAFINVSALYAFVDVCMYVCTHTCINNSTRYRHIPYICMYTHTVCVFVHTKCAPRMMAHITCAVLVLTCRI